MIVKPLTLTHVNWPVLNHSCEMLEITKVSNIADAEGASTSDPSSFAGALGVIIDKINTIKDGLRFSDIGLFHTHLSFLVEHKGIEDLIFEIGRYPLTFAPFPYGDFMVITGSMYSWKMSTIAALRQRKRTDAGEFFTQVYTILMQTGYREIFHSVRKVEWIPEIVVLEVKNV